MKLLYIAGPYRATMHASIADHVRAARDEQRRLTALLWQHGVFVVCPHAMTYGVDCGDDAYWLAATLAVCVTCDAIAVMRGSERSVGTQGEVAAMRKLEKPVIDLATTSDDELVDWAKHMNEPKRLG